MKTLYDPSVRASLRTTVSEMALREVGYTETPVNKTKYGAWFGWNGVPWCGMFVSMIYAFASQNVGVLNPLVGLQTKKGFAGTVVGLAKAKLKGMVLSSDETLLPGDVCIWVKSLVTGHTGIIVKVYPDGSFDVVEGNTSRTDHSSRNGGEVAVHRHNKGDGKHGRLSIIRPTRAIFKPKGRA